MNLPDIWERPTHKETIPVQHNTCHNKCESTEERDYLPGEGREGFTEEVAFVLGHKG